MGPGSRARWVLALAMAWMGCDGAISCDGDPPPPDFRPSEPLPPFFDGGRPRFDSGPPPDAGMPDAGRCPSHACSPESLECPPGSICAPSEPPRVIYDEGGVRCERPETPNVCEPEDILRGCGSMGSGYCGPCARCAGGRCLRNCDPSPSDRGGCPETQRCDWATGLCVEGCLTTCECRTYLDESGAVRFDERSSAVCDTFRGRCRQGSGGSVAGEPCTRNSQCEMDGECFADWLGGGYCSKYGCADGLGCEGTGSVCQTRVVGEPICTRGCAFAAELGDETAMYGPTGHGVGCREGYACFWSATARAGTPNSGSCLPGRYTERREPNVGAPCDALAMPDCWSPLGAGFCTGVGDGWCTVHDCGAPGLPADFCGPAAACRFLEGTDLSICFPTCGADADCPPRLVCTDSGSERVCALPT